jgi:uncharacterized cupin superfamily protein
MTDRRHPNVVHHDEVKPYSIDKGKHRMEGRILGVDAGSQQLGATLTTVPPGAISFPFHYHCANEEAIFVVSGTGTARIGDARVAVRAGDWIAHPIGPTHAHQMINDGTEPLVYLCVSTRLKTEVVGYPDSNKVGVRAGESFDEPWIREILRPGASLDYFDGEPNAK